MGSLISTDSFDETGNPNLSATTDDQGKAWTRHASIQGQWVVTAGMAYHTTAGLIYPLVSPGGADYKVGGNLYVRSNTGVAGIAARIQSGANTAYYAYHDGASNVWVLARIVAGTITVLGNSASATLTVGNTYKVEVECVGSQVRLLVNDVQIYSVTDSSPITGVGYGGLRTTGAVTSSTGRHVADFWIEDYSSVIGEFSARFA